MASGSAARAALTPRSPDEAPLTVRISISGEQDVARRLLGFEVYLTDLTAAWPGVDDAVHAIMAQQFASEGEHGGAAWAPLRPATIADRRRKGFGPAHPILRRTGTLSRSWTSLSGDAISVHAPKAYRRGSGTPYYRYLINKRPIVRLTAADKNEIMRPLRVYIRSGLPSDGTALARHVDTFAPTTGGAR